MKGGQYRNTVVLYGLVDLSGAALMRINITATLIIDDLLFYSFCVQERRETKSQNKTLWQQARYRNRLELVRTDQAHLGTRTE